VLHATGVVAGRCAAPSSVDSAVSDASISRISFVSVHANGRVQIAQIVDCA